MKTEIICAICQRLTPAKYAEKHHLVPRSKKGTETIDVCSNCGDQVHKIFTNKEMEKEYHVLDKILAHPDIQKWAKWAHKQSSFTFSMKSKNKGRN